jgi:hypothetical protein
MVLRVTVLNARDRSLVHYCMLGSHVEVAVDRSDTLLRSESAPGLVHAAARSSSMAETPKLSEGWTVPGRAYR